MSSTKEAKKKNEETTVASNSSLNLAIVGGVMGAGIGLLSSPGTSKKMMKSLGESEFVRIAGQELRKTAQDLLKEQAVNGLKQTASGYLSKGLLPSFSLSKNNDTENEKDSSEDEQLAQYEEIKEDNKNLNDRLERIENMLSNLVESKK